MPQVYAEAQIAIVKALLADAPRVSKLMPGAIRRISEATEVKPHTVLAIAQGTQWANVEPVPTAEVEGLVDWYADPDGWEPIPPQGQPLESA